MHALTSWQLVNTFTYNKINAWWLAIDPLSRFLKEQGADLKVPVLIAMEPEPSNLFWTVMIQSMEQPPTGKKWDLIEMECWVTHFCIIIPYCR